MDELGDDLLAVTDGVGVWRPAIKPLVISGCNQILAEQMRWGAFFSDQSQDSRFKQSVSMVFPLAAFGDGFNGVSSGAPDFVAGLFQFASGQLVVHQSEEMPAAFPVVGDGVGCGSHLARRIRAA